jgi:hypothetical protein
MMDFSLVIDASVIDARLIDALVIDAGLASNCCARCLLKPEGQQRVGGCFDYRSWFLT